MTQTEQSTHPYIRQDLPLDGIRFLFRHAGRYLSNTFKSHQPSHTSSRLTNAIVTPNMINERLRDARHENGQGGKFNDGAHAPEVR